MNEAVKSRRRGSEGRERLRVGFFRQGWRELQEVVALLEHGGEGVLEHAVHTLIALAERADSLGLGAVGAAVRDVVPRLGRQPARSLLVPLGQVLVPERAERFAPIAIVAGPRPYLLGPLEPMHHCERLHVVPSVEALREQVWFDRLQAVIVPVKPRRSLQELAVELPGRIWCWGPDGDARKRETAVRDGAAGYFSVPLESDVLLSRVRAATDRHLGPAPRVLLLAKDDRIAGPLAEALPAAGLGVWRGSGLADLVTLLEEGMPSAVLVAPPLDDGRIGEVVGTVRGHEHARGVPVLLVGSPSRHGLAPADFDGVYSPGAEPEETARTIAAILRRMAHGPAAEPRTGLPNRAAILHRLDEEFVRASRTRRPLAVALVEPLHPPGVSQEGPDRDRAVRALGRALRVGFRSYDLVGHVGADTLLVALPDCRASRAAERLDTIQAGLEQRFGADETLAGLSFFAGVADSTIGLEDLLERTDRALIEARVRGEAGVQEAEG